MLLSLSVRSLQGATTHQPSPAQVTSPATGTHRTAQGPGRTFKVRFESPGMQTKQLVTMNKGLVLRWGWRGGGNLTQC